ncbi:MAG: hypothetical protein BWY19_00754 [bacterium ADurb.Bin212]|nr:MAG: hypothetical protein BWY19_00754 [bacterium ADurb.Bin212]
MKKNLYPYVSLAFVVILLLFELTVVGDRLSLLSITILSSLFSVAIIITALKIRSLSVKSIFIVIGILGILYNVIGYLISKFIID